MLLCNEHGYPLRWSTYPEVVQNVLRIREKYCRDEVLERSAQILAYVEDRCEPHRKQYPTGEAQRREVDELCHRFASDPDGNLMIWVSRFAYAMYLPHKDITLGFVTKGAPLFKQMMFGLFYRGVARSKRLTRAVQTGYRTERKSTT